MKSSSVVLTLASLVFLMCVPRSQTCNKALCASDVSKCLIQELCQCRPGEGSCPCCKECMLCLGTLWDECCDCVVYTVFCLHASRGHQISFKVVVSHHVVAGN